MSLILLGCSGTDRGVLLSLDFTGASPALPSNFTFTRAGATATTLLPDGTGANSIVGANTARFTSGSGLLMEETRTQQLGVTDAPATQTVSLATGNFTLWVTGTGNCVVTAGTGTATGLGTATANTPNTFSVTGAGTFTFTVTGSLTVFQCENGATATSYIPNAGAAGTTVVRGADACTALTSSIIGLSASPRGITFIGKAITPFGGATATANTVFQMDDGTTNNRITVFETAAGALTNAVVLAAVNQASQVVSAAPANNLTIQYWSASAAANFAAQVIGQTKQTTSVGAVPGGLTNLRIGTRNAGSSPLNGFISKFQVYGARLGDTQAAALAAAL